MGKKRFAQTGQVAVVPAEPAATPDALEGLVDGLVDGLLQGQHAQYRLLGILGRGAFGTTYEGVRVGDERPVVVKVLPLSGLAGWKALELFQREAAALRAIEHPNVPRWLDDVALGAREAAGHSRTPRGFAIVMERIPGCNLRTLARGPGLSPEQMLRWFLDVLEVLAALHRRSPPVIHRDVNPKNIMVRPDGSAALVDFGSVQAGFQSALEGTLTAAGTFGYAPMEQLLGRATPASDLYGLGMSYLAVATGREPSQMPLSGPGVDVTRLLSGGPVPIPLIAKMVEPDPDLRLADAGWLLARLGVRASLSLQSAAEQVSRAALSEARDAPSSPAEVASQPPELYLARLGRRLAAQGFDVSPDGEIAHTRLAFYAQRPARGIRGFGLCLAVAPADWVEGQMPGKPAGPVPSALFARAVLNQAPGSSRLGAIVDAVVGRPNVAAAVIVCGEGIGSLTLGQVRSALADGGDSRAVAAFVDVVTGQVHLAPSRSFLESPRPDVLAALLRLLACETA